MANTRLRAGKSAAVTSSSEPITAALCNDATTELWREGTGPEQDAVHMGGKGCNGSTIGIGGDLFTLDGSFSLGGEATGGWHGSSRTAP